MTPLTINTLTDATIDGAGVFDVLMRANKAHLEAEFNKNRIKGPEYATVYLGSLTQVLQTAVSFLLANEKLGLEKQLLEQQILLTQVEVLKASAQVKQTEAQTELVKQQTANALAELAIIQANALKIPAEIAHLQAQTTMVGQQTTNLQDELLTSAVQRTQIEAQTNLVTQQRANLTAEALNIPKQGALIDAQKAKTDKDVLLADKQIAIAEQEVLVKQQQVLVATEEVAVARAKLINIPKEGALLDAQALNTSKQAALVEKEILVKTEQVLIAKEEVKVAAAKLLNLPKEGILLDKQALDIVAKTSMTDQQKANLVLEADNIPKQGAVLVGQKCKLDAEFDLLKTTNLKTAEEQALLAWKTTTEKAQTTSLGVDANSVIGKQKSLYTAQAEGFNRDAEQKAAKVMVDSWNVRRTTDEGTVADSTNMLNDAAVGRAVNKLLSGVGA